MGDLTARQRRPTQLAARSGKRRQLSVLTFTLLVVFALMDAAPLIRVIDNATRPLEPVLLLAFAWFIIAMAQRDFRDGKESHEGVIIAAGAIAVLGLVSAFWFGGDSWTAFLETILMPLLAFAGILSIQKSDLFRIGRSLNGVLFVVTSYQLIEYIRVVHLSGFSPGFISANHYNVSLHNEIGLFSFGNTDNASIIYVTALAVALVATRTASTRFMRRFGYLSTLTAVGAAYITGSRGAYISCLVAIAFALWPGSTTAGHGTKGLVAILSVVLVLTGLSVWSLLEIQPIQVQGTSTSVRYEAMIVGTQLALSRPLLGFGPGNVDNAVNGATQNSPYTAFAESSGSAYNLFVNWGIGTGVLSMLLMVILTIGGIRESVRARKLWAAAPLIAFIVPGCTVGSSLLTVGDYSWSFVFWICLALAWRPDWTQQTSRQHQREELEQGEFDGQHVIS